MNYEKIFAEYAPQFAVAFGLKSKASHMTRAGFADLLQEVAFRLDQNDYNCKWLQSLSEDLRDGWCVDARLKQIGAALQEVLCVQEPV